MSRQPRSTCSNCLGVEDEPTYPREREYLVLARVLLAKHEYELAAGLLERWHALAVAQQRTGSSIELRAPQALARAGGGDRSGALAALAEAVALGAPEGYLRAFADEGTPIAALLRELLVGRRLDYFREPAKTAEAMRGGWFHTGDAGHRRADGYFVFVDRIKDTIRRRGENISSFLVEKAVMAHPDVLEAAAVAVPSELSEDDVKVFVSVRPGATLAPAAVVEWAAGRLADFEVPRYVEFRDEFPRTETGRIQKNKLRAEGIGGAWDRDDSCGDRGEA